MTHVPDPSARDPKRAHKIAENHYRWVHETHLWKNPAFLFMIWRIFSLIFLGVALYVIAITLPGNSLKKTLSDVGLPLLYTWLFILGLIGFSYGVYALMVGGKYTVLFDMDNKGISHTQIPSQKSKADKLSIAATIAGLVAGQPAAAGAGLLAASSQGSMRSEFKKIRAVKVLRRRNTIKLRSSDLLHNQIYTDAEDFDFVLDFICSRVRVKLGNQK